MQAVQLGWGRRAAGDDDPAGADAGRREARAPRPASEINFDTRKHNWAFIGTMKQDRAAMIEQFTRQVPNGVSSATPATSWANPK